MTSSLDRIAAEALAIEREDAREAGALGYMARVLIQTTLPHRRTPGAEYERTNGAITLSVMAPTKVGLPYGRYPRLLISWMTTEAVRTKDRHLHFGDTLSGFFEKLGLPVTGGKRGAIRPLRNQAKRLFNSTVTITKGRGDTGEKMLVARAWNLWVEDENQIPLYGDDGYVVLSRDFYEEIVERPVPVDMRVLQALRSPLGLDLYCWLTYRASYLRKPIEIPWEALALQFGSDYKQTRQFKAAVLHQLGNVIKLYPDARVAEGDRGLILKPSPTHVRMLAQ